jgi:hypothetical protein
VWAIVLVLAAALACAWVVAVVLARMIAAEAVIGQADRRVAQARRDVMQIQAALGGVRRGLADDCTCGYVEIVDRAARRIGEAAASLED